MMGSGDAGGYTSVGGSTPQTPRHVQELPSVIYKVGIYGWRKRCLYLLVLLLLCTVIINFALTVWILRVMDFSLNGMGRLRISSSGIRLEGKAEFLRTVYATEVASRLGEALALHSTNNISLSARNGGGNVTGRLHIGSHDITSHNERFLIYDTKDKMLLYADENEVRIGTEAFTFTGSEGVVMEGPLETGDISALPGDSLRLQSLTSSISIAAQEGMDLSGGTGNLHMSCLGDMKLSTTQGQIVLTSPDVRIPGLPLSESGSSSRAGVYDVCVCESGRLFLSPPSVGCVSTVLCDET